MNKKKNLIFLFLFFSLASCSFDNRVTQGIWSGLEDEKKRIIELEKEQIKESKRKKVYSSTSTYYKEKILTKKITLSKPKKNSSWKTSGLNNQNFLGNIFLSGIENRFLKKKIGKNKLSLSPVTTLPLVHKKNIFLSDDKGTIFNITEFGDIIWKKNIYKKIYKRIHKNLTFAIHNNNIYVADNIGFIYAITLETGKLIWIKNHGIPLKSKIKIFNEQIFLINQDNRILSFSTKDGSIIWNVRSPSSFIKSQNLLSLALTKQGDVIASTSAGDLLKINSINGNVDWSLNSLGALFADDTDFFKSSDVVIIDNSIIFSTQKSIFSYNLNSGYMNWRANVSSIATPIIDNKNIFFVTENGYFVIVNIDTGEIISSSYILKVLKERKQLTKITGFIMGSGKIYSVTLNGYLIVSSAISGKVENFKKIGNPVTSLPIINDGKLFIYTEKSRILGFN
tara:strand:- start:917 stop:2272 length:1356 start_codon:yes stop_codon:yes gene_type:complete